MGTVASPASAAEALGMLQSALGYLATADATAMAADTQARCLQMLERSTAMGTAARASILAAFTSGPGVLRGRGLQPARLADPARPASPGAPRWPTPPGRAGRRAPGGRRGAGGGEMSESYARAICGWTGQAAAGLPGGRG